jgi:hypothetical protein
MVSSFGHPCRSDLGILILFRQKRQGKRSRRGFDTMIIRMKMRPLTELTTA